jgi:hypothetical protein
MRNAGRFMRIFVTPAGFEQAPRFLGIDNRGREVLTYIEGDMDGRPRRRPRSVHGYRRIADRCSFP